MKFYSDLFSILMFNTLFLHLTYKSTNLTDVIGIVYSVDPAERKSKENTKVVSRINFLITDTM